MGAWGYRYYENDGAADWFGWFWEKKGAKAFKGITKLVKEFDYGDDEAYDEIRAAAHVVSCFDNPYVVPLDFDRHEVARKMITILQNMINPDFEDCYFLEEWDHQQEVIDDVQGQIDRLKASLPEFQEESPEPEKADA